MNETDIRAELQRLALAGPTRPAQLDIDKMLRHGRRRIRRRRVGFLHASVAAAALVVLSAVGIFRLTADQFSGPSEPAQEQLEAGVGTYPANLLPWSVHANFPAQTGTGLAQHYMQQVTLVQGHVAY